MQNFQYNVALLHLGFLGDGAMNTTVVAGASTW